MSYILRSNEIYIPGERKQLVTELWNREKKVFSMIYDLPLHSVRFESNGLRRVFMIYNEGRRHPKTVLKNEYGFDAGVIDSATNDTEYGTIDLFGDIFYYNLNCQHEKMLHIYNSLGSMPVLSCLLEVIPGANFTGKNAGKLPEDFFNALLFGICWYVQIPAETAGQMVNPVFFHSDHSERRL